MNFKLKNDDEQKTYREVNGWVFKQRDGYRLSDSANKNIN